MLTATKTKKRRMYVDSSDSEAKEANEDAAAVNTEAQGGGMAGRLVAGVLARRRVDDEGAGGERGGSCRGPEWPWRWGEAGVGELAGVVAQANALRWLP